MSNAMPELSMKSIAERSMTRSTPDGTSAASIAAMSSAVDMSRSPRNATRYVPSSREDTSKAPGIASLPLYAFHCTPRRAVSSALVSAFCDATA